MKSDKENNSLVFHPLFSVKRMSESTHIIHRKAVELYSIHPQAVELRDIHLSHGDKKKIRRAPKRYRTIIIGHKKRNLRRFCRLKPVRIDPQPVDRDTAKSDRLVIDPTKISLSTMKNEGRIDIHDGNGIPFVIQFQNLPPKPSSKTSRDTFELRLNTSDEERDAWSKMSEKILSIVKLGYREARPPYGGYPPRAKVVRT